MKYDGLVTPVETPAVLESPRRWTEQNGVISFAVTSNGMTGKDWIAHFEQNNVRVTNTVQKKLLLNHFEITNGVTTDVRVLKGELWDDDDQRNTPNIYAEADRRKFVKLNGEVALLICAMFSNEEIEAMGLWRILVMHTTIKDFDGWPIFLMVDRYYGQRLLNAHDNCIYDRWNLHYGFAFALPQVS